MKKHIKVLRQCPLFQEIEEENLLRMLSCLGARVEDFDKKSVVLSEGAPAREIGILLSGSARVARVDYYGNRSILTELKTGDVFGEEYSCAGTAVMPVTVIANEPCEVVLIDCGHILRTCSNHCVFHERLIFNLMQELASKTLQFHQKIEIISKRTTRDKLLTYLMLQAQKAGSSSFDVPFDRQELADYLEVDRSGLSVEIGRLRREGVIANEKNHFSLL